MLLTGTTLDIDVTVITVTIQCTVTINSVTTILT